MKYNTYLQSYSHLVFSNRQPFGFFASKGMFKKGGRGEGGGCVLLSLVQELDLKDNTHMCSGEKRTRSKQKAFV